MFPLLCSGWWSVLEEAAKEARRATPCDSCHNLRLAIWAADVPLARPGSGGQRLAPRPRSTERRFVLASLARDPAIGAAGPGRSCATIRPWSRVPKGDRLEM